MQNTSIDACNSTLCKIKTCIDALLTHIILVFGTWIIYLTRTFSPYKNRPLFSIYMCCLVIFQWGRGPILHGTTMTAVQILTAALLISALISVRGLSNIACLDICPKFFKYHLPWYLSEVCLISLALISVRSQSNIPCPDICQRFV